MPRYLAVILDLYSLEQLRAAMGMVQGTSVDNYECVCT
jgi:hypothetical protein